MADKNSDAQAKASRKWEAKNRKKATIANYKRSAKSFIKNHAKKTDLEELKKLIREKENEMRTWERKGYVVEEEAFDGDLHEFNVIRDNGDLVATINPNTLENQQIIVSDLDNGEDVDGWEDGNGNTISL